MTTRISQLDNISTVQGNVLVPLVSNITGNLTTVKGSVDTLKAFIVAATEANIVTANIGIKGYVDSVTTAWTANAGQQLSDLGNLYANASSQQSTLNSLLANAGSQSDLIIGINANVAAANLGMIGYVDNKVSTANIGVLGYVVQQATLQADAANARATLSNTIVTAGVVSANLGLKGYVDNSVTTANVGIIGYINLANTSMASYVNSQTYSNVQTLSLLATSTGNIAYDGVLISNPNYITVSNTWVYTLSSTVSDNILLVTSTGLSATINMPVGAVDGQVATFSANAKLTITAGTGTVQPTFTGANILVSSFRYIYRSADSIWYRN